MWHGVQRKGGVQRDYCGIARVIVPPTSDRETFVKHCYQTSSLSIIARENLDVMHDVDIDPSILQRIEFPDTKDFLGSTVVWVNIPVFNRPVIVGILNGKDEMTHLEEGEFSFTKDGPDGSVVIQGLARGAQLNLSAVSSTGTGGSMKINVGNLNNTGELSIIVSGELLIDCVRSQIEALESHKWLVNDGEEGSKNTSLELTKEEAILSILEGTSGFKIVEDKFSIGKANDKAVLANKLDTFMGSLIDVIASQTVVTSLGPQPLVNAAGISSMKAKTKDWISNYLEIE